MALKNMSDTIRHVMQLDKAAPETTDDLPELVVRELAVEEIERMRDDEYASDADDDEPVTGS